MIDWNSGGLERIEQRLQRDHQRTGARLHARPAAGSPYPGIHAFEAEDAAIYFGRDDETRARHRAARCAQRRQGGARLLVMVGASGSGKSSLLQAPACCRSSRAGARDWIAAAADPAREGAARGARQGDRRATRQAARRGAPGTSGCAGRTRSPRRRAAEGPARRRSRRRHACCCRSTSSRRRSRSRTAAERDALPAAARRRCSIRRATCR